MPNLSEIKCPNCGAGIIIVDKKKTTCEYCNSHFYIENPEEGNFKTTFPLAYSRKEDVLKAFENFLIREDSTPIDILKNSKITRFELILYPFYSFSGKLKGTYKFSPGFLQTILKSKKQKGPKLLSVEKELNFQISVPLIHPEISEDVKVLINEFNPNHFKEKASPEQIPFPLKTIDFNSENGNNAFFTYGTQLLKAQFRSLAEKELSNRSYRNLDVFFSSDIQSTIQYYLPVWNLELTYNNQKFIYVANASKTPFFKGDKPRDDDFRNQLKTQDTPFYNYLLFLCAYSAFGVINTIYLNQPEDGTWMSIFMSAIFTPSWWIRNGLLWSVSFFLHQKGKLKKEDMLLNRRKMKRSIVE
ncbi:MAG: hypothetical protein H7A24_17830 [Leptospiraceae bacterium]|nr:hypothetical protein [Leptospiraceae bacterium]MCP5513755.1 hypothetical protein [Leptospiraceae bacterium]